MTEASARTLVGTDNSKISLVKNYILVGLGYYSFRRHSYRTHQWTGRHH